MYNIKQLVKRLLPAGIQRRLAVTYGKYIEFQVFSYDKKRFKRYYLKNVKSANYKQLEAKLTFHAHSLEKGLSRDDLRLGFGKRALSSLAEAMKIYNIKGYDKTTRAYVNALSTVKAYSGIHKANDYNTSYLDDMFGGIMREVQECRSDIGGAMIVEGATKKDNRTKNFEELFLGRWSIRTYSDAPVVINTIKQAVQLAMKSPSVCNRQASKVHVLRDEELIGKVLRVQGGFAGYSMPPVLLAVTTDSSSFIAVTERNQVYTDGGIFSMSLLLSLEYYGLAACPLNAMFDVGRDKAVRRLLRLKPSENIIMFISVGNFKQKNNVPKSFRLDIDDIFRIVEES